MKQTAVEYLVKELSEILGPLKTEAMQDLLLVDAINKAKEMEKQQIINCSIKTIQSYFIDSMNWLEEEIVFTENDLKNQKEYAEQYYKETFNK